MPQDWMRAGVGPAEDVGEPRRVRGLPFTVPQVVEPRGPRWQRRRGGGPGLPGCHRVAEDWKTEMKGVGVFGENMMLLSKKGVSPVFT